MKNYTCPNLNTCPDSCKGCGWEKINFDEPITYQPIYLHVDNVNQRLDELLNYTSKELLSIIRQICVNPNNKNISYSKLENAYAHIMEDFYKLSEVIKNGKSN